MTAFTGKTCTLTVTFDVNRALTVLQRRPPSNYPKPHYYQFPPTILLKKLQLMYYCNFLLQKPITSTSLFLRIRLRVGLKPSQFNQLIKIPQQSYSSNKLFVDLMLQRNCYLTAVKTFYQTSLFQLPRFYKRTNKTPQHIARRLTDFVRGLIKHLLP